ncbi:ABC transporter permease [Domibacillus sp. A3M-37]|uniref:ABC transporter permease n=1 Tax=Domibacillus sp. A3M-37 TaxID=2962037 RepID=UPI0020B78E2C|nr:ABC transporter permease [Domibacillus sp. A3M-37]MCP3762636.1 ABC transporter permease [Domibacillus sp. A3M-37]
MFLLIPNEWIKLFKRRGTYVMIGLLLLMVSAFAALTKYEENKQSEQPDWKQVVQAENAAYAQQLNDQREMTADQRAHIEGQIEINEYRLTENVPVQTSEYMWSFVENASDFLQVDGLFMIVVAGGIVANEYTWGTIKLLLIRPISRSKILLSKYVAVVLFGLFLVSMLFLFSVIIGAALFGLSGQSAHLAYVNGQVVEQNMLFYLVKLYAMKSVEVLILATMAFMISAVFRSSSLAIGISLFLLFMGPNVTYILSMRYEWAKYLLFANTNLLQYETGTAMVEGMTMSFSLIMLLIYFLVFQLFAFTVFAKRDVAG